MKLDARAAASSSSISRQRDFWSPRGNLILGRAIERYGGTEESGGSIWWAGLGGGEFEGTGGGGREGGGRGGKVRREEGETGGTDWRGTGRGENREGRGENRGGGKSGAL